MKLTPKGMRDILPEDMFVREDVMAKILGVFRSYGYRPMETPAMEYLETLRAKAGEEVDKQIFVIDGKEYGLRFDLTVPLARAVANSDFPKPFKRYTVERVWRKEEPQRGRFREFYQADADIIGSKSMRSEAELLTMAKEICESFGFKKPPIMLNNKKILESLAEKMQLKDKKDDVFRVLDKLDKIGEAKVRKEIEKSIGKEKTEELFGLIRTKGTNKQKLTAAKKLSEEGAQELEEILALCDFEIEIDLSLVRGLGYYTGPVFEIKLAEGIGTVIAGGRYDSLLSLYGQSEPATGISVGIERLITLMLERKKGTKKTNSKIFVAAVKPEFYKHALATAAEFHKAGVQCETDLNERNLRKQLDYANALAIPFAAIVGEREVTEKKVMFRDMFSGKEELLSIQEAITKVKGR